MKATLIVVIVWLLLHFVVTDAAVGRGAPKSSDTQGGEISYVLEPFEEMNPKWIIGTSGTSTMNLTLSEDSIIPSTRALKIDYEVSKDEGWGGSDHLTYMSNRGDASSKTTTRTSHSCEGATHLSLWYKVLEPQSLPESAYIRLILFDASDCIGEECGTWENVEHYLSFQHILDETQPVWKELRIELHGSQSMSSPFLLAGFNGVFGNRQLDLSQLIGFRITVQMHWKVEDDASSKGSILFDQMACVGGADLLSAALRGSTENDYLSSRSAVDLEWKEFANGQQLYNVFASNRNDFIVLDREKGMVEVDYPRYALNDTTSWRGELTIHHEAPDAAYYNLSQVEAFVLDYEMSKDTIVLPATAQARLAVLSGMNNSFSWHSVLSSELVAGSTNKSVVSGSLTKQATSNNELDMARVKGFSVDVSLHVREVQGLESIRVGALRGKFVGGPLQEAPLTNSSSRCVVEPGIFIKGIHKTNFRELPFATSNCCEMCLGNPDCYFAGIRQDHCYHGSTIQSWRVQMQGSSKQYQKSSIMWIDDVEKRGDYCDRCECREEDQTIDCRGADLALLPKTFGQSKDLMNRPSWTPRVLDLRENERLVMIGSGALESITESLKELRLPKGLRYISPIDMKHLGSCNVTAIFESEEEKVGKGKLINAIRSSDETAFFGDVCCSRGENVPFELEGGDNGMTLCNMTVDSPGIDSVYEPFWQFNKGKWLEEISPTSPLFSEAAGSLENCAEYCTIIRECNYFEYDQRKAKSVHKCYLLVSNTPPTERCCSPNDYADNDLTIAGRISGIPPSTRHYEMDAAVIVRQNKIVLNERNGFEAKFTYSLGSTPLRGAVWVEPGLDSSLASTVVNVTFNPSRVVLYDVNSTAIVSVSVLDGGLLTKKQTLVVFSEIHACDTAFMEDNAKSVVFIDVEVDGMNLILIICLTFAALLVMAVGSVYLIMFYRRKHSDSIWLVKRSELRFSDPPEVAGRGTFGLVLLAEYRGTVVAVKRVIPPKPARRSEVFSSDEEKEDINEEYESSVATESSMNDMFSTGNADKLGDEENVRRTRQRLGSPRIEPRLWQVKGTHRDRGSLMGSGRPWKRLKEDFIVEMRILSKLRHPCITTVMGAVISRNEEPLLIMEYMDHGSLYDLLKNDTLLLEGELLLPILRDVAQGMRFLHAATPQVIHADLKAQNVLVDSKFRAKVADFGLSQKKHVGAIGTPFWMAPELLSGKSRVTTACDVYSFGIMLYEVYARKEPYEGEDPERVLLEVADPGINKRPPCPVSCPAQVKFLMNDCVDADPTKRPSFEELDQRLKRANAETLEPGEVLQSLQQLKKEKLALHRSNALLFEVFPEHIARALSEGRKIEPEQKEVVTIFFSDIVGFTEITSSLSPMKISDMLDRLYLKFDAISREFDVFKVETIGDAYMAVTNLVKDQPDHTKRITEFAIATIAAAQNTLIDVDDPERGTIQIRAGLDVGPVVANVVGSINPRYCLFGDTVNTASRMESTSESHRIQCSERAAQMLLHQAPEIKIASRGRIKVKGKGEMSTYWVNEKGTTTRPSSKASRARMPQRTYSTRMIGSTVVSTRNPIQRRRNSMR